MDDRIVRRFSRRQVIQGLALAVGGLAGSSVLAACGSPTPAPAAKPAETAKPAEAAKPAAPAATSAPAAAAPAQPAQGAVTLKAMYWSSSPEDHKLFEDVFTAFQDKNPGIAVEFDDVPSDDFQQTALTRIVGGTPPDTMELHPSWVLSFILANQLIDLSEKVKDQKAAYVPAQLDFWSNKDKLYGVPYYSGPSFMFYNKSVFQKAGMKTPEEHEKEGTWTWDTLQQLAKQTTSGSGADKVFGWDGAHDVTNIQFYTSVPVWCNQGEWTDKEETAWQLDTPAVTEVFQWHADLQVKDKAIPLPSDLQGISWLFRTGRVAMAWAGRFRSIELVNATFDVGMVGTPKGKAGPINRDGPNASGLPVGTKNVDSALKLALFMGGPDAAPVYLASGRALPVQTALFDSDAFKKSLKPFERLEVLTNAAKTVRAWRVPGKGAEELRTLKAEWDKVLIGQEDVPTAMKNAKAAMDPLLKVR
jgi:multiple sugar transport system substrate-binding protein